jgi:zinc/manganese transport system substrate-binding protein
MTFPLSRRAVLASLAALPFATARANAALPVVASFSILGDFAKAVGGDRVAVTSIVGPDGDAHVYSPTPADSAKLAGARIIVVNGLGLEGWMDRLVAVSGAKAAPVVASRDVTPRREKDDAGRMAVDPHAWQTAGNARLYVGAIRDALIQADSDGRATYEANAKAYLAELDALDRDIRAKIASIPAGRRRLVSTHDAFGYFAEAYGLAFIAPEGLSSDADVSGKDIAKIVREVRRQNVPAVFIENISDPRLMDTIAREAKVRIGGKLYSDALSPPDGPAPTYLAMMRHNVETLVAALVPPA